MAVPRTAVGAQSARRPLLLLVSSPYSSTSTSTHASTRHQPFQSRAIHARAEPQPVPNPTPFVPNPATFLKLIGRDMSKHADKFPTWSSLFTLSSTQLRDVGLEPARARKYLLRWREKFRQGEFGIGGDVKHVNEEGEAEIALVEVPWEIARELQRKNLWTSTKEISRPPSGSLVQSPGMQLCVLNVPFGSSPRSQPSEQAEGKEGDASAETATTDSAVDPTDTNAESTETAAASTETTADGAEPATKPANSDKPQSRPIHKLLGNAIQDIPASVIRNCTPVNGVKRIGVSMICGPHIEFIRGARQKAAILRPKEGMWEHRRGEKLDGGERRRDEVRAKRRAKERKAA